MWVLELVMEVGDEVADVASIASIPLAEVERAEM